MSRPSLGATCIGCHCSGAITLPYMTKLNDSDPHLGETGNTEEGVPYPKQGIRVHSRRWTLSGRLRESAMIDANLEGPRLHNGLGLFAAGMLARQPGPLPVTRPRLVRQAQAAESSRPVGNQRKTFSRPLWRWPSR